MKLPLGLLIEECVEHCRCENRQEWENNWIQEIALYSPEVDCRQEYMYIVLDGTEISGRDFGVSLS